MEKTKGNDLIDLMKFIGSIMIFTMHCRAFSCFANADFLWQILSRWGVPFFFIGSSYFLFKKQANGNIAREQLTKYAKRIGILYGIWFVYNLPSIYAIRIMGKPMTDTLTIVNLLTNTFLSSTFTGSWYLLSSIFFAWVVFALSKKIKTELLVVLTLPLHLLCVITSVYCYGLPFKIADFAVNILQFPSNTFVGVFYFALGKYIAEKENSLKKTPLGICIASAVVFYILFIFENYFAKGKGVFGFSDQGIFLAPATFFLFLICLKTNVTIKSAPTLRKLSTIIYCCQGNVLVVKEAANRLVLRKIIPGYSILLSYICALAIVAIICVIILWLQKKFKFAKYFT